MVAVAWLINFLMLQGRPFSMVLCYDEEWLFSFTVIWWLKKQIISTGDFK